MSQQRLTKSPAKTKQRIERRPVASRSFQGGLHPLLQLQRTIGNRAVGRLIQAKLTVSHPGDPYEQAAANGVAEHVTSLPTPDSTATAQHQLMPDQEKDTQPLQTKPAASMTPLAQRQAMPDEDQKEAPPVQKKPLAESITPLAQRQMIPDEEKNEAQPVQMQSTLQRAAGAESGDAGAGVEQQLGQSSGTGSRASPGGGAQGRQLYYCVKPYLTYELKLEPEGGGPPIKLAEGEVLRLIASVKNSYKVEQVKTGTIGLVDMHIAQICAAPVAPVCCCKITGLRPSFVGRIEDKYMGHKFNVEIDIENVPVPAGTAGGECRYEWNETPGNPQDTEKFIGFSGWQSRKKASQHCPSKETIHDTDTPMVALNYGGTRLLSIKADAHSAPGCGGSHSFTVKQFLSIRQGQAYWRDPPPNGVQISFLEINGNKQDSEPYNGQVVPNPLTTPP